MCGILAVLDRRKPMADAPLRAALTSMAHRGPDGEGMQFVWEQRLFLGHRRLGIFDPGAGGHQPMQDPATGNWLIFNGALYNYLELRAELEALGHRFQSQSDTEVLLLAWRQWGTAALPRFNGMWAIVLFDAQADRLYISRDRLGVKPLYWADTGDRLAFGSECRAVAQAAALPLTPDPQMVHDFLLLGLSDHRPNSFFKGILCVPPGSLWSINRDGHIDQARFHDWRTTPAPVMPLRELLADATALRLRADVPSALLLSGGLDSAIVAWAAQQASADKPDQIIAYGYAGGGPHDETERARQTAAALGLGDRLTEIRVAPTPPRPALTQMIARQQQPVNTPSVIAAFRLYQHLRGQGLTVALTGEGSDELFGGYTRRYLPLMLRDALRRGRLGTAWHLARSGHCSPGIFAGRLAWDLPAVALRRILRWQRPHIRCVSPGFWQQSQPWFDDLVAGQRRSLAEQLQEDPLRGVLPYALRFADANGMAWGVEVRSPFLDWRVAAAALALDPSEKLSVRGGKQILRRTFADVLPAAVTETPKTHGLGMAEQFTVGAMDLTDLFTDPPAHAAEFLDLPRLQTEIAAHPTDLKLWWPVCLLLWLRWLETETAARASA